MSRSSPGQIVSRESVSALQVRLRCLTQSWLQPDQGLQVDHVPSRTAINEKRDACNLNDTIFKVSLI